MIWQPYIAALFTTIIMITMVVIFAWVGYHVLRPARGKKVKREAISNDPLED